MAIKATVEFKGISVVNAYIRVITPVIQPGNDRVEFNVTLSVDANSTSFDNYIGECPYDLEGENPFKQVYAYLKGLERFSAGEDC